MIHIILDQENNKGVINIRGRSLEIANDFANLVRKLYEETPNIYLLLLKVLEDQANEIIKEEEAKKNDQNNFSNKSDQ